MQACLYVQIAFPETNRTGQTMLAKEVCQSFLKKTLLSIHAKRVDALFETSWALTKEAKLTLSDLGRHKEGKAQVKHKIKSVDRLLGNQKLQSEYPLICKELFASVLYALPILYVIVDWSGCCRADMHMLRASLMQDGRSITLYNEIHPVEKVGDPKVHLGFLFKLKSMIPAGKPVVIVTDAGFARPWFRSVLKMGWDFIGRITKSYTVKLKNQWVSVREINEQATTRIKYLGYGTIGKGELLGHVYVLKQTPKNRKEKSRFPAINKRYTKANKTPWVLVSSLLPSIYKPNNIKNIYKKRMHIEQNFRDDKNPRWGFGWRFSRTKCPKRMSILCLVANIASFLLHWIGFMAEKIGLHKKYQVNTCKKRVLSRLFLAKQILLHEGFNISNKFWYKSAQQFAFEYTDFILWQ